MFKKEKWDGNLLQVPSGWRGLEEFMKSIIHNLNINPELALEFGVDSGYSLKVLSQLFNKTIGVDPFIGDKHIGHSQGDEFYKNVLKKFEEDKVEIVRKDFKTFANNNNNKYDLIHIDIVHFYNETFECADWSAQHSNVVLLHDTMTFPEMARVCRDISAKHKFEFYNIPYHNGLGVLYKR